MKKEVKRQPPSNIIRAKPNEKVSYKDILREVEARTGFRYSDIRLVYMTIIDVMIEKIKEKKVVRIPKLGQLFPSIKRASKARNLHTNEPIVVPARWLLKFQPGPKISMEVMDMPLTQEEEDEMYSFEKK